jgi:hypothetical protein
MRVWGLAMLPLLLVTGFIPAYAELALYDPAQRRELVRIGDRDIESIVLEERRTTVTETGQKFLGEPYYAVTFVLRPRAAKTLSAVLGRHDNGRLELRLGDASLGTVRPIGPFEGNEFTYYTKSKKPELERAFAGVKPKLVWRRAAETP